MDLGASGAHSTSSHSHLHVYSSIPLSIYPVHPQGPVKDGLSKTRSTLEGVLGVWCVFG